MHVFLVEVRPAPHMDNLVSIYKNMEAASGVNMLVTQNAPATNLSGESLCFRAFCFHISISMSHTAFSFLIFLCLAL